MSETMAAPYPQFTSPPPCAGRDDLFFSAEPPQRAQAAALCRTCPVIADCLAYALTHDVHGVWAATGLARRRELRRAYGITAVPVALTDTASRQDQVLALDRGGASARWVATQVGVTSRTVVRIRARTRRSA